MELELVPPASTPEHDAVRAALLAAGVALEQSAPAYAAAWREAAVAEGVERAFLLEHVSDPLARIRNAQDP